MARYVDDYQGISGHPEESRGRDPNYRGGYSGMRMRGGYGQAAYGRYRMNHEQEFGGPADTSAMYADRGYERYLPRGYDRDWQGGGVRDLRNDPEAMRDFNANSMSFRRGRGYDRDMGRPEGRYDESMFGHDRRYRMGYANRGLSSGGYSEGWAWGPMRGSR